jgi:hypothetical protein
MSAAVAVRAGRGGCVCVACAVFGAASRGVGGVGRGGRLRRGLGVRLRRLDLERFCWPSFDGRRRARRPLLPPRRRTGTQARGRTRRGLIPDPSGNASHIWSLSRQGPLCERIDWPPRAATTMAVIAFVTTWSPKAPTCFSISSQQTMMAGQPLATRCADRSSKYRPGRRSL